MRELWLRRAEGEARLGVSQCGQALLGVFSLPLGPRDQELRGDRQMGGESERLR